MNTISTASHSARPPMAHLDPRNGSKAFRIWPHSPLLRIDVVNIPPIYYPPTQPVRITWKQNIAVIRSIFIIILPARTFARPAGRLTIIRIEIRITLTLVGVLVVVVLFLRSTITFTVLTLRDTRDTRRFSHAFNRTLLFDLDSLLWLRSRIYFETEAREDCPVSGDVRGAGEVISIAKIRYGIIIGWGERYRCFSNSINS